MKRYTVSIQLYEDVEEVRRQNFWVYAPSWDEALTYLDIQLDNAWTRIRIAQLESESDTKPE